MVHELTSRRRFLTASLGLAGAGMAAWTGFGGSSWLHMPFSDGATDLPPVSAASVFAFGMDTRTVLYDLNADRRLPPASTATIATALVAVNHAALDEEVVIDEIDQVDTLRYSNMGLVAGDTLTLEQLLYGLLLPSGGDAAKALARVVGAKLPGGTVDDPDTSSAAFVAAMNELVGRLHLTNSHFVNPTGNDAPDQYSSARDLALLAAELLEHETLATIVRTPSWAGTTVGPERRPLQVFNTNRLLAEDDRVIGVKTGATPDARTCLVAAKEYAEGARVIAAALGCAGRYDDAGNLVVDGRWDDMRAIFASLDEDHRSIDR